MTLLVADEGTGSPSAGEGPTSRALSGLYGERMRRLVELTWALSKKNFKIRYKRATLGVLWAVVQPALQAAILAYVFSHVIGFGRGSHYPLYVLSGVLPYAYFSQAVSAATTSALENSALVTKVRVPLAIFPLSAIGGSLLAFGSAVPILVVGAAVSGTLGWTIVLLPAALLAETLLAVGVGFVTAAYHPGLRDVRYLVEAALQVLLYATPVVYVTASTSGALHDVLRCNPLTGILDIYRYALLGRAPDVPSLIVSLASSVLLCGLGGLTYSRRSGEFADLL